MKFIQKTGAFLLVAALLLSILSGCGNPEPPTESTTPTQPSQGNGSYTVMVSTRGGMPLSGVEVLVYADKTLEDNINYGQTDENGICSFDMPKSEDYAVVLRHLPEGYSVEPYYTFYSGVANIMVTSAPIADKNLSGASFKLGDVMYDFTVATTDGSEVTLSEVLKEKKMVLLNFFYTTCSPCINEFPFMQQAYEMYSDSVEVIALDPFVADTGDTVKAFKETMGLTFPMADCNETWSPSNLFGTGGYPTSVLIDRYGVICLIEVGGLTSIRPFTGMFDYFTADDYEQKLFTSLNELVTAVKPTVSMDTSENIGAAINGGDIQVTYRPEADDEFAWPFVISDKNGAACLKASNQEIEGSYAILYADVYLKAGQAIGFDYICSSEALSDILYVIVNEEPIYQISGATDTDNWKPCYPWVAQEDGYYELALCYIKDDSNNVGEDTAYIRNMRVVDSSDIDISTFIPRQAATTKDDGFTYDYVDIFFNESDGYYHVGSENGPLLLADLMGFTDFNEEKSIYFMLYDGDVSVDGVSYYDTMLPYFTLASNSALNGVCTVTKELAEQLKTVASIAGFDGTENEWLKICKYFEVYGADGAQLQDPIKGLKPFCAFTATLGKNVQTNYFYYDRVIIPRGLLAEFVPEKSGVYRFTSHSSVSDGVEGWLFDENGQVLYTYEREERMYEDNNNVSIVYYMEAGKSYYLNIAFWDVYETGYIYYDVEYIAKEWDMFCLASPGYFTYDSGASGDDMYFTISGGIDVILGSDGYYYHDLGDGKLGSMLYADFTGITGVFNMPIANVGDITGMIDRGAFDFTKTEYDEYVLTYLKNNDFDVNATDTELRKIWGEEYEAYAELYQIEDVYAGIYHGKGADLTEEIRTYLDGIITSGSEERLGCVPVTERLAEILQLLMEKYTFENVECSWPKLCYYYKHFGPAA